MPSDEILGHSDEADGIEEYDNALPGWWLGLFAITIVIGVAYGIHWFATDQSQTAIYEAEVAAAEQQWPAPAADAPIATDAASVDAGKAVYDQNCVACHGADMKGGIGPDLTDAEWVHGGTIEEIRTTVTDGVPEKGMLAWGAILGPDKVAKVSAYVHAGGGGL